MLMVVFLFLRSLFLWVLGCVEPGWYRFFSGACWTNKYVGHIFSTRPSAPRWHFPDGPSAFRGSLQQSATLLHAVTFRQLTTLSGRLCLSVARRLYPTLPSLSCAFHGCQVHMLLSLREEKRSILQPPNLFTSFIRERHLLVPSDSVIRAWLWLMSFQARLSKTSGSRSSDCFRCEEFGPCRAADPRSAGFCLPCQDKSVSDKWSCGFYKAAKRASNNVSKSAPKLSFLKRKLSH